ncbi:MAG: glucose 1-dehydrogenase [Thermoleophilia bacterium]|nr:glucose 1-dehydrogenase [Thermoleophilia bacterium]
MGGMFAGKVALVTGGATGIGKVTAQYFAREGAKVLVSTRQNIAEGEETVRLIREAGGEAHFVRCDVSKEDEVRAMVEECVAVFGRLDFAFNNAGVGPDGKRVPFYSIVDFPEAVWDHTLDTNLKGVFLCLKYEMIQMIRQGWGGAIVNTSSAAAVHMDPNFAAYNSSKSGLTGLTRTAALEGGPHGIRVNAVLPGPIQNTLLWEYLTSTNPDVSDKLVQQLPLRRIGRPEDVAEAVIWLCSDKASFITGQSLCVDGGLTAS